jgi:hypothetical protein
MYDWMYYVAFGLVLFLTAFSFTAPKAKDDQSEYTGNNPNLPVMKNPPPCPPPPLRGRPKTPPAPNPKPNC